LRAGDDIDDLDCDEPPGCVRCRSDMTAASVTVRRDTLDIRNPLVRHLVPCGRVASVPRG